MKTTDRRTMLSTVAASLGVASLAFGRQPAASGAEKAGANKRIEDRMVEGSETFERLDRKIQPIIGRLPANDVREGFIEISRALRELRDAFDVDRKYS